MKTPEEIREYQREYQNEYRKLNRDDILSKRKIFYNANYDKQSLYQKTYRIKHDYDKIIVCSSCGKQIKIMSITGHINSKRHQQYPGPVI